ncbi:AGAP006640-PA-like protein [Anopheles sinensis]|uniref:AGAP006640-PA-like protein n=1 Tax=Anopheles sinensis TaxID=74873 RepID=A0A084WME7_ANOSI|nr:AGAP006640-PA-like protein [Anopheles sinensis]
MDFQSAMETFAEAWVAASTGEQVSERAELSGRFPRPRANRNWWEVQKLKDVLWTLVGSGCSFMPVGTLPAYLENPSPLSQHS